MPWYDGSSLMHHLEHVHVASDRDLVDARFPVQYVVRPKSDEFHDYRGYAGQVAGGVLKPGDDVLVLPSGMTSKIAGIDLFDKEITEAYPPMSVTVRLEDDVDVSRGDMICRPANAPKPSQDIDAMICWMTNEPLKPRQKLAIKHTTRTGRALIKDIQYRLDVNSLHRDQDTKERAQRDRPCRCTTVPLLCDPYSKNRTTGSFILIDEATGVTVGAGMIKRVLSAQRVLHLRNPMRHYAWGSSTHIPRLCGLGPADRPVAEMWFRAHPGDPSLLDDGRTLADAVAADPEGLLGRKSASRSATGCPT